MRRLGFPLLRAGLLPLVAVWALGSVDGFARRAEAQPPVPPAAGQLGTEPSLEAPFIRRQIFVGLPTSQEGSRGQLFLAPNVNIGSEVSTGPEPGRAQYRSTAANEDVTSRILQANAEETTTSLEPPSPGPGFGTGEVLPTPDGMFAPNPSAPIFSEIIEQPMQQQQPITGWRAWLLSKTSNGPGLGRERLAFAPFAIDVASPNPNIGMKFNSVQGQQYPDRSEYLWARIGARGPKLPESGVDYVDSIFNMELGSKKFSAATQIPFRFLNPDRNPNHTSIGDMSVATKLVIIDGKTWRITQLFRSYFPTGSPSMGLGNGHVAFEPGFLMRYNHCDTTFFHGEFKYYFPVGGDPTFQGQLVTYGLGVSKILFEGDNYAVMPTLEFVGNYIANGRRTEPNGVVTDAEGDHVMALYPGVRFSRDRGSDLGLFEWGVSTGIPITGPRFYNSILKLDVRWAF